MKKLIALAAFLLAGHQASIRRCRHGLCRDSASPRRTISGAAWAGYVPPAGMQIAYEMHEYLDSDYSGSHAVCAGQGSAPMVAATQWAQANNAKIWIGEIGWSQDPSCPPDATNLMSYFTANEPTYLGWAYWLGGSQAFYGSYIYTAQPTGYPSGPFTDKPQMSILTSNLN